MSYILEVVDESKDEHVETPKENEEI
jgi:hypothetical protein